MRTSEVFDSLVDAEAISDFCVSSQLVYAVAYIDGNFYKVAVEKVDEEWVKGHFPDTHAFYCTEENKNVTT